MKFPSINKRLILAVAFNLEGYPDYDWMFNSTPQTIL